MSAAAASVLALVLLALPAATAAETACGELFKSEPGALIAAGHSQFKGVRFANGRACSSDTGEPDRCDWQNEIVDDRPLGENLRFLRVNSSHRTGSGAWDYVAVSACVSGRILPAFAERFRSGIRIESVSPSELVFVGGEWKKEDPMCCPSARKRVVYRWDGVRHRFAHAETTVYTPDR